MNINTNNQLYAGTIFSSGSDNVSLPDIEIHNKVLLISHSSNLSVAYVVGMEIAPNQIMAFNVDNLNLLYISSNSGETNNISYIGN